MVREILLQAERNDVVIDAEQPLIKRINEALLSLKAQPDDDAYCLVPEDFNQKLSVRVVKHPRLQNEIVVGIKSNSNTPGVIVVYNENALDSGEKFAAVVPIGFYPHKRFVKLSLA